MEEANNQSLMSILVPPLDADGVSYYLNVVGSALGCRTDADLARVMDFPPSAIANWRRRGRVAAKGVEWFENRLIPEVAVPGPDATRSFDAGASNALIEFLVATKGNPLGATVDVGWVSAMALPGLLVLSKLIASLMFLHDRTTGAFDDPQIVDNLRAAMPAFARSPIFERFTTGLST